MVKNARDAGPALPSLPSQNAWGDLKRSELLRVCGIDEAGRGPWAGPVVAAAVILDPEQIPDGLNDSKVMTHAARERSYAAIIAMKFANDIEVYVSAFAGGLIEVISGINFYLYFRTARQFAAFHTCLERTNRFLIANDMCEHLGVRKDEMRAAKLTINNCTSPLLSAECARS